MLGDGPSCVEGLSFRRLKKGSNRSHLSVWWRQED